jgi:hypothetical protein
MLSNTLFFLYASVLAMMVSGNWFDCGSAENRSMSSPHMVEWSQI